MNRSRIKTPLGVLHSRVRNDPDYPGIDICLERNGQSILLAWVEVDRSGMELAVKLRLYADCRDDEPTDNRAIVPSELDEYFAGLAAGRIELV